VVRESPARRGTQSCRIDISAAIKNVGVDQYGTPQRGDGDRRM